MKDEIFSLEKIELLAAAYVLDDLDEDEKEQVDNLIQTSSAMQEEIKKFLATMSILATSVPERSPSPSLKTKISKSFQENFHSDNLSNALLMPTRFSNWFQKIFTEGWQTLDELLSDSTFALESFRNSGVSGGKKINISDNKSIILAVKIKKSSPTVFNILLEVLPTKTQPYLPQLLKTKIINAEGLVQSEFTSDEKTENITFDLSGKLGEAFSVEFVFQDRNVIEKFIV